MVYFLPRRPGGTLCSIFKEIGLAAQTSGRNVSFIVKLESTIRLCHKSATKDKKGPDFHHKKPTKYAQIKPERESCLHQLCWIMGNYLPNGEAHHPMNGLKRSDPPVAGLMLVLLFSGAPS